MLSYSDTMRLGAASYRDVLEVLSDAGYVATFTQTGGMCAAIEIRLDGGGALLVTDADDSLAWSRADHRGWGAGVYENDNYDSRQLAYEATEDGSPTALVSLIAEVLRQAVRATNNLGSIANPWGDTRAHFE